MAGPAENQGDDRLALWVGSVAIALLAAGLLYAVYWDVRLDLFGVRGFAWVDDVTVSSGQGEYSYRKYCHVYLRVPLARQQAPPPDAERAALLKGARDVKLEWRQDDLDACAAHRHTWMKCLYDEASPDHLRRASDPGVLLGGLALGGLFALLYGVRVLVLRLRRPVG